MLLLLLLLLPLLLLLLLLESLRKQPPDCTWPASPPLVPAGLAAQRQRQRAQLHLGAALRAAPAGRHAAGHPRLLAARAALRLRLQRQRRGQRGGAAAAVLSRPARRRLPLRGLCAHGAAAGAAARGGAAAAQGAEVPALRPRVPEHHQLPALRGEPPGRVARQGRARRGGCVGRGCCTGAAFGQLGCLRVEQDARLLLLPGAHTCTRLTPHVPAPPHHTPQTPSSWPPFGTGWARRSSGACWTCGASPTASACCARCVLVLGCLAGGGCVGGCLRPWASSACLPRWQAVDTQSCPPPAPAPRSWRRSCCTASARAPPTA